VTEAVKYAVVIEQAGQNYSAYVPDLPGCISVGDTIPETERNIRDAIALHIDALRAHGDIIPDPTTTVEYVEAPIAAAS
jgi:predicted RNase H-like HicB family nuclease